MHLSQKFFVLAIGGLLLFGVSGCQQGSQNLKFSVSECSKDANPYSGSSVGVLSQKWEGDNTLVVGTFIKAICPEDKISGNYEVNGENLSLKYRIERETSGFYASAVSLSQANEKCSCSQKLRYEISDLEKKQYIISIDSE